MTVITSYWDNAEQDNVAETATYIVSESADSAVKG